MFPGSWTLFRVSLESSIYREVPCRKLRSLCSPRSCLRRGQAPRNRSLILSGLRVASVAMLLSTTTGRKHGWRTLSEIRRTTQNLCWDFEHEDPVRTFGLDEVAFVYGSRWKQRYFTKRGDDYFPLPAQWDVKKRRWLPYHVEAGADWWVPFYGPTTFDRPTGPTCDGCHSVNYNIETKQVTEWNVGCEKCHGPGSEHIGHPTQTNIVNPARLD